MSKESRNRDAAMAQTLKKSSYHKPENVYKRRWAEFNAKLNNLLKPGGSYR